MPRVDKRIFPYISLKSPFLTHQFNLNGPVWVVYRPSLSLHSALSPRKRGLIADSLQREHATRTSDFFSIYLYTTVDGWDPANPLRLVVVCPLRKRRVSWNPKWLVGNGKNFSHQLRSTDHHSPESFSCGATATPRQPPWIKCPNGQQSNGSPLPSFAVGPSRFLRRCFLGGLVGNQNHPDIYIYTQMLHVCYVYLHLP